MKQIGIAMHNYHGATNSLPSGVYGCCNGTWQTFILPFMELGAMSNAYNFSNSRYSDPANTTVTFSTLGSFLCPSDTPSKPTSTALGAANLGKITAHNYVANFGQTDIDQQTNIVTDAVYGGTLPFQGAPFSWIAPYFNGNHSASPAKGQPIGFANITDGLSNTILCSELVAGKASDLRGVTWWADASHFTTNLPPNSTLPDKLYATTACGYPGNGNTPCVVSTTATTGPTSSLPPLYQSARSLHPGGVNSLMVDGSVKFLKNTINVRTWRALSSTQGGEVVSADAY